MTLIFLFGKGFETLSKPLRNPFQTLVKPFRKRFKTPILIIFCSTLNDALVFDVRWIDLKHPSNFFIDFLSHKNPFFIGDFVRFSCMSFKPFRKGL